MEQSIKGIVSLKPAGYFKPEGIVQLTEQGTHNVAQYEFAEVKTESTLKKVLDATKSTAYLFYGCTNTSVDNLISYDDTENIENMIYMFKECSNLTSIPLLNTSNVTDMTGMFVDCKNLTTIPQLDTSKVTTMSSLFDNCWNLTTVPLIDTSNVTNMYGMFSDCHRLTSIPQLNTSKNKSMYNMFAGCRSLTSIPALDTSNVTSIRDFVSGCYNLKTIEGINMISVTDSSTRFLFNCPELENIKLYNVKSSITDIYYASKITLDSLIFIIKELINVNASRTLTIGSTNLNKLANVYVKLTNEPEEDENNPKLPFAVCESTDEGAMLITDYVALKNWSLA